MELQRPSAVGHVSTPVEPGVVLGALCDMIPIMRVIIRFVAIFLITPTLALADPPSNPINTFDTAKKKARNNVYFDHRITLYCSCAYEHSTSASGGVIDPTGCGYEVRADAERGGQLEWEHIMPAFEFGHLRTCWREGHDDCEKPDGTKFKGRECCKKPGVDPEFRRILSDLHNLAPSVGELNADRSNHPYGVVEGEHRAYGSCDFEVSESPPKVAEPMDSILGDVARAWLYMSETYNVRLSQEERRVFLGWHEGDEVSDWERLRDERIETIQGNRNSLVGR